jgi:MFS family permease
LNGQAGQRSFTVSISLAHATVHCTELTYAALLLRIGDQFGVDKLVLGFIANAFALAFGIGALPSGLLVDRLGSARVLRVCFLTAAGASLLVALSPSPLALGILLTILGFCIGLYHPAAVSLIAQAAERRGLVLGYHGMAGNIGVAAAPAIALAFASTVGWRWSYVFLAGLALAMVILLQLLRLPALSEGRPRADRAATAPQRTAKVAIAALVLIYLAYVLNGFIYRGSITFLPTLIEEQVHIRFLGIDEAALAGSLTTLALLTGGVGQYLGGSLSDRVVPERLAPVIAAAVVPALLLVGFSSGLLVVAAVAVFVFFNFAGQPVYNLLMADYAPGTALGRSYGLSFFAAFGLGSTAATFSGLLADRWGTSSVFLALAAFAAVVLALAVALWRLSLRRPLRGKPAADTMKGAYHAPGEIAG